MDKEKLKKIFKNAKEEKRDVAIELTVPTRNATEIIIVKNDNLDYKLDYYLNNYDDNLILKRCAEIKILNAKVIDFKM